MKECDIVGKKLDDLIPSIIQPEHQNYIKEFLNQQTSHEVYFKIKNIENNESSNI